MPSCEVEDCNVKYAVYGIEGERAKRCVRHATPEMIDVKNNTCKFNGCSKNPCFNIKGSKKGLYCREHATPEMIDVKNNTCKFNGCRTRSRYGFPGYIATYCAKHKQDGHICCPTSRCKHPKCKNQALYSSLSKKPMRCEEHKLDEDINIVERECTQCHIPEILNQQGLCTYCDPNHFNQFRLGKQRQVKASINCMEIKKYIVSYDEAVNYKSCQDRTRPDFMFETPNGTHYVVVEVDENQHYGRLEACECTRMVNITHSNQRPTLFIRYNPDKYFVRKHGRKHTQNPSHNKRMIFLEEVLKWAIHMSVENLCIIGVCAMKKLYFNEFDDSNCNWITILSHTS